MRAYVLLVASIAALGGRLFGYDTGVALAALAISFAQPRLSGSLGMRAPISTKVSVRPT